MFRRHSRRTISLARLRTSPEPMGFLAVGGHGAKHSSQIPQPSSSMLDAGRNLRQHGHVVVSGAHVSSRSGGRISNIEFRPHIGRASIHGDAPVSGYTRDSKPRRLHTRQLTAQIQSMRTAIMSFWTYSLREYRHRSDRPRCQSAPHRR